MAKFTDEQMMALLPTTKDYTIVLLKPGPKMDHPEVRQIIWEHGRKNFEMRAEGKLAIVCPVTVESGLSGMGIFTTGIDETRELMEDDPGVKAGVFIYEIFPCKSFPGDTLP